MSLTDDDLKKISLLINTGLGGLKSYIDEKFSEAFRLLPNKQDFFFRMDRLSGEYKKIDEAETLHAGQLSEHTDELEKHDERIKAIESRHDSKPTPPFAV